MKDNTEESAASPSEKLVNFLRQNRLTIATAESCTGGMIGEAITGVAGASDVYGVGFITYANEAKERLLGVKHETLREFGAVSKETAAEMARGALRSSGADVAVAVTGIAGPGGGSPEKPVGLVYVGVSFNSGETVKAYRFSGDRQAIREETTHAALKDVYAAVKNQYSA